MEWGYTIEVLVYIWMIISIVIVSLWFLFPEPESPDYEPSPRIIDYFISISALIGCFLILNKGFKEMLFFIPNSWFKWDEHYGEYVKTRTALANLIAFFATIFLIFLYGTGYKARKIEKGKEINKQKIDE